MPSSMDVFTNHHLSSISKAALSLCPAAGLASWTSWLLEKPLEQLQHCWDTAKRGEGPRLDLKGK